MKWLTHDLINKLMIPPQRGGLFLALSVAWRDVPRTRQNIHRNLIVCYD